MHIRDWIINHIQQRTNQHVHTTQQRQLIGREAELEILNSILKKVKDGSGCICIIHGEAGHGKTFLLDHFIKNSLPKKGVEICKYRCEEISKNIAFSPLIETFNSLPQSFELSTLSEITAKFFQSNENVKTLYFKIAGLIKRLCRQSPILFCIENADYCDESTLDFLRFFSREIHHIPFVVVLTFDVQDAQKISFSQNTEFIPLRALSNSLAMSYLHQRFFPNIFPYEFMEKFAETTGGVPLFWDTLSDLFVNEKNIINKKGVWSLKKEWQKLYFPASLKETIQEQLRLIIRKRPKYFAIIKYASILGSTFSKKALQEITSITEKEFLRFKAEIIVLQQTKHYQFKNSLTHQLIYNKVDEKQSIHELALVHYRKQPNTIKNFLANLIYHSENASRFALFTKYCYLAAKEEKKKLAYHNAVYFCMKAMPYLKKGENEKFKIMICLSSSLISIEKFTEARRYLSQLLEECDKENKDYMNALFLIAELEKLDNNEKQAQDWLHKIIDSKFSSEEQKILAINKIVQTYLKQRNWNIIENLLDRGEKIAAQLEDQRFLGSTLYNLAKCLLQKGDLQKAFDAYKRCTDIYKKNGNFIALVQCYNFIAHIYFLQGLINKSIEFYEKTMDLLEKIDAEEQRVKVELDFAQVLLQRRMYKRSKKLLEKSYAYYQNTGNMSKMAIVLCIQGRLQVEMGNFIAARKKLEKSIEINRDHKDIVSQAMCVENIGVFFFQKGQWEKAKPKFEKSALIWEMAGMKKNQVITLNYLGDCCWCQKEITRALSLFEQSLAISQNVFPDQEAQTLNKLAKIFCFKCDWQKAHESLEKSITLQTKLGVLLERCCTYTILGHLYLKQGNFTDAEVQYSQSYEIHRELNDVSGQAQDILHIGRMYLVASRVDDALEQFAKSLELYIEEDDAEMQAMLHEQMARGYRKKNNFDKANEMLNIALKLKQDLPEWKKADTYYGLGRCALFSKSLEEAVNFFHKGLELYQKIQDRYKISKVLNNIGEVLISQGYYLLAMEHFAQSYILKENMQDVEGLAYTHMHIGRAYMRLNRMDKATENFEKSVTHWEILGHDEYVAELSYQLGELYEREGQIEHARNNFTRAQHFFKNINRKRLAIIGQKLEELE